MCGPTNLRQAPSWRHPHLHLHPVLLSRFHWRSKKSLLLAKKQNIIIDVYLYRFQLDSLKKHQVGLPIVNVASLAHFMNRRNAAEPRMSMLIFFVSNWFEFNYSAKTWFHDRLRLKSHRSNQPISLASTMRINKTVSLWLVEFELNGIV